MRLLELAIKPTLFSLFRYHVVYQHPYSVSSKLVNFIYFSDVTSLMHIEKAITSGSVLVLHNVNEHVDSIFLPLIYRINTNTKDGICDGKYVLMILYSMHGVIQILYLSCVHASQ
jgi:hypothetical protein